MLVEIIHQVLLGMNSPVHAKFLILNPQHLSCELIKICTFSEMCVHALSKEKRTTILIVCM